MWIGLVQKMGVPTKSNQTELAQKSVPTRKSNQTCSLQKVELFCTEYEVEPLYSTEEMKLCRQIRLITFSD